MNVIINFSIILFKLLMQMPNISYLLLCESEREREREYIFKYFMKTRFKYFSYIKYSEVFSYL